jgi:hypothetical protein
VKVVHFSKTPLAGAPIRLVEALQRYTKYDVHLVDLKRWDRWKLCNAIPSTMCTSWI